MNERVPSVYWSMYEYVFVLLLLALCMLTR